MTWTSTQQRHERMMNGQYSQGFHKKIRKSKGNSRYCIYYCLDKIPI